MYMPLSFPSIAAFIISIADSPGSEGRSADHLSANLFLARSSPGSWYPGSESGSAPMSKAP